MTERVIYSSDVSIEDHASVVVFRNFDGLLETIFIERLEPTEQVLIYNLELFNKPSDSWVDAEDLKSLNSSCDSDYTIDEVLTEDRQIRFTEDLCWYYGAVNFDSYPNEFLSYGSFVEWLESRDLIEKSED